MYKILFLLFSLSLHPQFANAQWDNYNQIFDNEIRSVLINPSSATPVVQLQGGQINLTFDHIGYDIKNYVYSLQHCNSDWQNSDLTQVEFQGGFTEDRIFDIRASLATLVPYTQYRLTLPNQNMRWLVSGNYVLKVFDDDDEHRLVLVRRFMVTEGQWTVQASMAPISNASKIFTHQEIDFFVKHENFRIANPVSEGKGFGAPKYALGNRFASTAPRPFIAAANLLNLISRIPLYFRGAKNGGFLICARWIFRGLVSKQSAEWATVHKPGSKSESDQSSTKGRYGLIADINGRYNVENNTTGQDDRQTDYVYTRFDLQMGQSIENRDVYVFGELTDWMLKPEFKMEYDEVGKNYTCNPLLKQGYYNYQFMVVNPVTFMPDPAYDLEGNWHETGNLYTILVYYRPLMSRYDRLMALGGIDSRIRK